MLRTQPAAGRRILQEQETAPPTDDSSIQVIDLAPAPRRPASTGRAQLRARLRAQRLAATNAQAGAAAQQAVIVNTAGNETAYMKVTPSIDYTYNTLLVGRQFTLQVQVANINGPAASPAGILRVWTEGPPGAISCGSIPPKSAAFKIGAIGAQFVGYPLFLTVKAPAAPGNFTLKVFLDTCSKAPLYSAEATLDIQVRPVPGPDLKIEGVDLSPRSPAVGQTFKAILFITNSYLSSGPHPKPFRIRLYLDASYDFVPTCNSQPDYAPSILSEPITKKIKPGQGFRYVFTVTAANTTGSKRLTFFVDSGCQLPEDREGDNVFSTSYDVLAPPALPDLVISIPGWSLPVPLKAAKPFKLKIYVSNNGNADATSLGIVKYWNDRAKEDKVDCQTLGGTPITPASVKVRVYDILGGSHQAPVTLTLMAPSQPGDYVLWLLVNAECTDQVTTNNADYVQFTVK